MSADGRSPADPSRARRLRNGSHASARLREDATDSEERAGGRSGGEKRQRRPRSSCRSLSACPAAGAKPTLRGQARHSSQALPQVIRRPVAERRSYKTITEVDSAGAADGLASRDQETWEAQDESGLGKDSGRGSPRGSRRAGRFRCGRSSVWRVWKAYRSQLERAKPQGHRCFPSRSQRTSARKIVRNPTQPFSVIVVSNALKDKISWGDDPNGSRRDFRVSPLISGRLTLKQVFDR